MSEETPSENPWRDREDIAVYTMEDGVNAYAAGWSTTGDLMYAVAMDGYTVSYMPTMGGQKANWDGFIEYDDGRSTHIFANGATGWGDKEKPESYAAFQDFKFAVDSMNNERFVVVPNDSTDTVPLGDLQDAALAERGVNVAFYDSLKARYGEEPVNEVLGTKPAPLPTPDPAF